LVDELVSQSLAVFDAVVIIRDDPNELLSEELPEDLPISAGGVSD
jgi:hypothetical protein